MKHQAALLLCLAAAWPLAATAQPTDLTAQQRHGRQLMVQSCGVCHLPADLNAKPFGPPLNKAAANGDDSLMRAFILTGGPDMPGWKYYLSSTDIDDIIAYARTVPEPAAAASR
jgi:mono/diheme cytochrome c family protein